MTSPQGPVYLSLPREVLGEVVEKAPESNWHRRARPRAPEAAPADIDQLADWIAAAQSSDHHRYAGARPARERWCWRGWRNVRRCPWCRSTRGISPCRPIIPMFLGSAPGPLLKDADLVIVFETDVPWIPSREDPPAGARIVQIGEDPLYDALPMRGFPSDLTITATSLSVLEALETALANRTTPHVDGRRARLTQRSAELRNSWREEVERAGATPTRSRCPGSIIVCARLSTPTLL